MTAVIEQDAEEINTQETARILGVSQSHVCWYIRNGRLPARELPYGNGVYLLKRQDVLDFKRTLKPRKKSKKT